MKRRPAPTTAIRTGLLAVGMVSLTGCATLQSVFALSDVGFSLDSVLRVEVAGVNMAGIQGYDDLSVADALRVGSAVSAGTLPLDLTLELSGANPEDNPEARLTALEWTLHVRDRETVSGLVDREVRFPSGETTPFPLDLSLDLVEFFSGSAREVIEVAVEIASGGTTAPIRLEILPTVETPLGPIRYPRPLVLEPGGTR